MNGRKLWRPGLTLADEQKTGINVFVCPVCRCVRRGPWGEIACTGPSETRDEHPMTPMTLKS